MLHIPCCRKPPLDSLAALGLAILRDRLEAFVVVRSAPACRVPAVLPLQAIPLQAMLQAIPLQAILRVIFQAWQQAILHERRRHPRCGHRGRVRRAVAPFEGRQPGDQPGGVSKLLIGDIHLALLWGRQGVVEVLVSLPHEAAAKASTPESDVRLREGHRGAWVVLDVLEPADGELAHEERPVGGERVACAKGRVREAEGRGTQAEGVAGVELDLVQRERAKRVPARRNERVVRIPLERGYAAAASASAALLLLAGLHFEGR